MTASRLPRSDRRRQSSVTWRPLVVHQQDIRRPIALGARSRMTCSRWRSISVSSAIVTSWSSHPVSPLDVSTPRPRRTSAPQSVPHTAQSSDRRAYPGTPVIGDGLATTCRYPSCRLSNPALNSANVPECCEIDNSEWALRDDVRTRTVGEYRQTGLRRQAASDPKRPPRRCRSEAPVEGPDAIRSTALERGVRTSAILAGR